MGVQFWQEISNCVIRLVYQWDMKKCEETDFLMFEGNYMTQPSTTQVLARPARSEQYGLFLTLNDWTKCVFNP